MRLNVTEAQRHQLFESVKAVFGESSAEIFMNLHPHVEWDNLATKDDLAHLEAEFARLEAVTRSDFVEFRAEMKAEMKAELAALEVRLQNRFVTVLLASQGVLLAAITLLIALARP